MRPNTKIDAKLPTVLIVDDHKIIHDCIIMLAERERKFRVVGVASNGDKALEAVKQLRPDIMLLDIHLPTINGLEVARTVQSMKIATNIIILTMYSDSPRYVQDLFACGIKGYVTKTSALEEVGNAVDQVMSGYRYISPEASRFLTGIAEPTATPINNENKIHFTDRELTILSLLVNGKTSQEIADLLAISTRTVETHRHRMLIKSGERNMSALIRYAMNNGLLASDHKQELT